MSDFFPPDVRVRIEGEPQDARPYLGRSREVLFKALNLQAAGQSLPIKLTQRLDDNAYVQVLLTGNQKIVFISAAPVPPEVRPIEPEKPEVEIPEEPPFLDMLSGWVRYGNIVTGTNTTSHTSFLALDAYKPTAPTAKVHGLKQDFGRIRRLAVSGMGSDVFLNPSPAKGAMQDVKSSMYSGAMKEVVQAIYGLGVIADASPQYISGAPPVPARRGVKLYYDYKGARTHGVVKAADKNWWLIEISVTRGVLAMPLPLIRSTATRGYRLQCKARKEIETLAVCEKFGGLPSGETFPTGATLTAAIASGKVLQLLRASDLTPYYSKAIYASQIGWAFAEPDQKADNTCWDIDDTVGVKVGYHYGIDIFLTPYDLTQIPLGFPVGSGTAALKLRESGYLSGPSDALVNPVMASIRIYDESLGTMDLFDFTVDSTKNNFAITNDTPMFVFYRGNEREVLRYYYIHTAGDHTVTDHLSTGTRRVNDQFYGTSIDKREWSYLFSAVYYDNSIVSSHFSTLGTYIYAEAFPLGATGTSTLYLRRVDNDKLQRIARSQIGGAAVVKYLREGYVINSYKRDGGFQRNSSVFLEPTFEAINNVTGAGDASGVGFQAINGTPGVTPPFWENLAGTQVSTGSFESFEYFAVVGNYGVLAGNSLREDNVQDRHAGGNAFSSTGSVIGTSPSASFLAAVTTSYTQVPAPVGGYPPLAAWNKFKDPTVIVSMSADFNAGPTKGILLEGRAVPSTDTADIVNDFVRRGANLDGLTPADISWIGRV